MSKIILDKYYTPIDIAKKCIEKTFEVIGLNNITEIIEPSAGNGSFSLQIPNCIAYDIEPEHSTILRHDFLKLELPYKKGRLIIGNPPFGEKMNLAQKFYKRGVEIGDYIAFILPISQLWNTNSLYEFDLLYSEDLGKTKYSNVHLHCCLNIYKRNKNGINNKPINKLKTIKIIIHSEFKDRVIKVLETVNWFKELNCIAMLKIQQFHIINVLKNIYLNYINYNIVPKYNWLDHNLQ